MTDQKTDILTMLREALDEHDARVSAAREQQTQTEIKLGRIDTILAGGQIYEANGERERKILNLVAYYHRTNGDKGIAYGFETAATRQAIKERDEALARVANEPVMLDEYRRQLDKIKAAAHGAGFRSSETIAQEITAMAASLRSLGWDSQQDPVAWAKNKLEETKAGLADMGSAMDDLRAQRDEAQAEITALRARLVGPQAPSRRQMERPADFDLPAALREFGPALRTLRETHAIRLGELARALGCEPVALSDVELGESYAAGAKTQERARIAEYAARWRRCCESAGWDPEVDARPGDGPEKLVAFIERSQALLVKPLRELARCNGDKSDPQRVVELTVERIQADRREIERLRAANRDLAAKIASAPGSGLRKRLKEAERIAGNPGELGKRQAELAEIEQQTRTARARRDALLAAERRDPTGKGGVYIEVREALKALGWDGASEPKAWTSQRRELEQAKLEAAEKRATAAESDLEALDEVVQAARKTPTNGPPEDVLTLGPKLRAMGPALRQLREQHGIRLADFCRATDAHAPGLAAIELGLEPLWDAMLSAEEAEKRLGTVPPESDLHVALRNVGLRDKVFKLELELQALKVNPCTTCVRERDTARAERDEAQKRGARTADLMSTSLNTAVAERDEARAQAEDLRVKLANKRERLTLQILNEAMPLGYKLVSETDEYGTWHRWQTHETSGGRWTNPAGALSEAWAEVKR